MSSPVRISRRRLLVAAGSSVLLGACAGDSSGGDPAVDAASDAASDAGSDSGLDAAIDTSPDVPGPDATDVAELAPDVAADVAADVPFEPTPEMRWPACDGSATLQTVTFVHVNDLHGAFNPDNGGSPLGRIRAYYLAARDENPYTVFTNAGDDYEKGTVAELMTEGRITRELIEAMQFDVRCIGNHDFCWSLESLLDFTRDPYAQTLLSNVTYTGPQPERFGARDVAILEVGCVRVGFFGMVSKAWNERNQQTDEPFFPELPMRSDYIERARELVAALGDEVDVVVMLSHLGLGTDRAVAEMVPGIHFVLGGHSHSVLAREEVVGNTIIVQAGSSASFVARLDVDVDLRTRAVSGYRYRLDPNLPMALPSDPTMDATVQRLYDDLAPDALATTGFSSGSYGGERLAALTARIVVQLGLAELALCDPWTVWSPLPRGKVGPQHYLDCFKVERQPAGTPGFNAFYSVEMLGADVLRARDEGDNTWQFAGPLDTLDPARTYTVAVQKHIAYNPEAYWPAGVTAGTPTLLGEAWELMDRWGRQRAADCLALDDEISFSCE